MEINMTALKESYPELDYIVDTIFRSSLRTELPKVEVSETELRLSYDGTRSIIIKNPIITKEKPCGSLGMACLPDEYVPVINERRVPVYLTREDNGAPLICDSGDNVVFNFDVLYSAFYILTRSEEIGSTNLDHWGRFPASASHAYKNNYLHRPVVDEYTEILWHCMKKLWPSLRRKERKFEMMLTHDVDEPFEALFRPAWRMIRSFGSDVLRRRDIARAVDRARLWFRVKRGDLECDRVYNFDLIMDIGETAGCKDAFYFIPDCSGRMSGDYNLEHPAIRSLIRHIHERGHEIGYHGSFDTYMNSDKTQCEVKRLKTIAEQEGVAQTRWGGRQHYLRWSALQTWRNYEVAGLDYDTTLSFADAAGFRCGTCRPYRVFDVENRKRLKLLEYPLTVMECSVLSAGYMGYSYEKAQEYILQLKRQCRRYRGIFVMLWHNSRFETEQDWQIYRAILAG